MRLDKEIVYRRESEGFANENVIQLPGGYKDKFDVLINEKGDKVWLCYEGKDRNLFYANAVVSANGNLSWQGNNLSTTNYARNIRKNLMLEAEDLYIRGKNNGLESVKNIIL